MGQDDFYKVLDVDQKADERQIKDAYRKLAFAFHPDRNKDDPIAAEKMKKVNEAYAVLSNPEKRRQYDAMRRQFGANASDRFRQNYSEQDIFSGSDINAVLDEMAKAFGFRGVDEIFKEFYGQGYQSFEFKRSGFSARGFVFKGSFKNSKTPKNSKILGAASVLPGGVLGKLSRIALEKVGGVVLPEPGQDVVDDIYLTPELARAGGPYPYFHRKRDKKLVVNVPGGMKAGQKIRLPGMGSKGKGGGNSGDLYLKINFKKPFLKKIKDVIEDLRSS
jgi:DnaJ-class molecular chaperone